MPLSTSLGRTVAAALVWLAPLVPAAGASTAVTRVGEDAPYAQAGTEVLVIRVQGRVLRLLAHPAGGGAGVERFRFTARPGAVPEAQFAASAELVGLAVGTESDRSSLEASQAFTGPPAGPLAPLGSLRRTRATSFVPIAFIVGGGRALLAEVRGDFGAARLSVLEAGQPPIAVSVPRTTTAFGLAGELMAYAVAEPGQAGDEDEPARLIVREWRTGRVRGSTIIPGGVESLDLP